MYTSVLIYLFIGMLLGYLVEWQSRRDHTKGLTPAAFIICVLIWPLAILHGIKEEIKKK